MKPMAPLIKRHQRLHRSLIEAEHRAAWPVLTEAEARAVDARIPAARRVAAEPDDADPREALIETYKRVMSR